MRGAGVGAHGVPLVVGVVGVVVRSFVVVVVVVVGTVSGLCGAAACGRWTLGCGMPA
jgi:hypothetical protein